MSSLNWILNNLCDIYININVICECIDDMIDIELVCIPR